MLSLFICLDSEKKATKSSNVENELGKKKTVQLKRKQKNGDKTNKLLITAANTERVKEILSSRADYHKHISTEKDVLPILNKTTQLPTKQPTDFCTPSAHLACFSPKPATFTKMLQHDAPTDNYTSPYIPPFPYLPPSPLQVMQATPATENDGFSISNSLSYCSDYQYENLNTMHTGRNLGEEIRQPWSTSQAHIGTSQAHINSPCPGCQPLLSALGNRIDFLEDKLDRLKHKSRKVCEGLVLCHIIKSVNKCIGKTLVNRSKVHLLKTNDWLMRQGSKMECHNLVT